MWDTSHAGSRWYTSDFEIQASVPPWRWGSYTSLAGIGVKCLQPGGDSLIHVGICCKSLATEVVLKGSKRMRIDRRKVGIATLPVIVLRYDTLTVFYPGCMATWAMCMCPFTWRNLRLRMQFHVGWADAKFLKLQFLRVFKVAQLWRVVQPSVACATLCLMYTKLKALDI